MDKEKVRHEERGERTRCEEMVHGGKEETEGKGATESRRKAVYGKEMTTPTQALLRID